MTRRRLLIVGAGGHGRAVAEAVLACGEFDVAGFMDDAAEGSAQFRGIPVLGPIASLESHRKLADAAIVAIGNNRLREEFHARLGEARIDVVTVVHPRAVISPSAIIGEGCALMPGAIVGTQARLGAGVIVNCAAVVDHHCTVEDFGHLGVNACMAGGSVVGRGAWMQAGSALGYGVRLNAGEVLQPGEGRSTGRG